jgi:hypothetical protein
MVSWRMRRLVLSKSDRRGKKRKKRKKRRKWNEKSKEERMR